SHPPLADGGTLRLGYTAVDGVQHTTEIASPAKAWRVARKPARARVSTVVAPGERSSLRVEIRVRSSLAAPKLGKRDWRAWEKSSTIFVSDSPDLDAWLARSSLDLFLLSDSTADGYFPAAGIPWFVAPFGRDSILTALFALPLRRDLAPAVLRMLADHQGKADVPQRDAEPGRIAHEIRQGEVQAYAYAAWRSLAEVVARRDPPWAASLVARADRMRTRFERAFWVAQRSFYAQALDGRKRQIRDVVSNPGHVLWTGIASPAR